MSMISIVADGTTRLFAYPFGIFSADELHVRIDGVTVTEGVDIIGEGGHEGGYVAFLYPPLAGSTVVLSRRGRVEVSNSDIPGYLADKLVAGDNIAITIGDGPCPDSKVLVVSATSDSAGHLSMDQNLADVTDVAMARTNLGVYSVPETDAAIAAAAPDLSPFARKDQNLADLTDVAAARANLGLGSGAMLDAVNVVQLDAQGRLPAVDGSQLTNIPFGRVKVSETDTVADFLDTKLVAGDGIALAVEAGASGDQLVISSNGGGSEAWTDLGSGTELVIDGTGGANLVFTMTGATTISAVNLQAGRIHSFMIRLHQDATGGHVFTLPANTKWPYGEVPLWPSAADEYSLFTLSTWDQGATWLASFIGAEYS